MRSEGPEKPREALILAASLTPEMHEGLTEGRRFPFKLNDGKQDRYYTARAAQAAEPGYICIFDFEPVAV